MRAKHLKKMNSYFAWGKQKPISFHLDPQVHTCFLTEIAFTESSKHSHALSELAHSPHAVLVVISHAHLALSYSGMVQTCETYI